MKIYLAASFAFKDKEISKQRIKDIDYVASILRDRGYDVFVPHEHKIPNGEMLPNDIWALKVMEMDKNALDESDCVIILSYGKYGNNAGVAWEAGYAYGRNKKINLVKMNKEVESMMMWYNVDNIIFDVESLRDYDFDIKRKIDIHDIELS